MNILYLKPCDTDKTRQDQMPGGIHTLRSGHIFSHQPQRQRQPRICTIVDVMQSVRCPDTETCTICLEKFADSDKSCYTIPQCNHTFHTSCLMQWFRQEMRCPLCRDNGLGQEPDGRRMGSKGIGKLPLIRKICRRKDAPPLLVQILKKRDEIEKKRLAAAKELKLATSTKQPTIYAKHQALVRKLRNRVWDLRIKVAQVESQLSCFTVTEILIIKK